MATNKVGFIKQHRSIMNEVIWEWPAVRLKIYMTIYLMVNYSPNEWTFRGTTYNCEPGETVTSYNSIVKECRSSDITLKMVRTTCRLLQDEGYITIEPNHKKNIKIKLLNWNQTQLKNDMRAQFGAQLRAQFGAQNENAESTDNKGKIDDEENKRAQLRAQFGAQNGATIEELKEGEEEEEEDRAANSTEKEPNQLLGSEVVNLYYKLYREYIKTEPNVNEYRDNNLLSKYPAIERDDMDRVSGKLRGWFIDTDAWKENNKFPFAAFLKQYDNVRELKKERSNVIAGQCEICRETLYEGSDHECTFRGFCDNCNVGWIYKASEPEKATHNCKAYKLRECEELEKAYGRKHTICPECQQIVFKEDNGNLQNHQCGDKWLYGGQYYNTEEERDQAAAEWKAEIRKNINIAK